MDIYALRKVLWSLFWVIAMVLVCGRRGYGMFVRLPVVSLLFWIPYCLWVAVTRPKFRAMLLSQLGLWLTGVALCIGVHNWRDNRARDDADGILHKLQAYQAAHGHYPETLAEIGFGGDTPKLRWDVTYSRARDEPFFAFSSSFDQMDVYIYDFKNNQWNLKYD